MHKLLNVIETQPLLTENRRSIDCDMMNKDAQRDQVSQVSG